MSSGVGVENAENEVWFLFTVVLLNFSGPGKT